MKADRMLLNTMIWMLFLGGVFGLLMALVKFFGGDEPSVYGVLGIGGGIWMIGSAFAVYVREHMGAQG